LANKKPKKQLSAYNRHVQKEMKAGKSMKQAAASWRGSNTAPRKTLAQRARALRTRRTNSPRKPSSNKGGRSNVSKKGGFNTQKIFKYVRWAALGAPAARIATLQTSTPDKLRRGIEAYTGYNIENGQFNLGKLAEGWGPYLTASVTTYGIPKLISIIRGL
jgi:hypothetical protein